MDGLIGIYKRKTGWMGQRDIDKTHVHSKPYTCNLVYFLLFDA